MALQFAMVAMGSALRGTGNFKPGMIVATTTVILNMVLAPFLIFGWVTGVPLGVAGAAMSSLVAVAVGVAWLGLYFIKPSAYLHFVPSQWVPQFSLWGQMLKIGLPAGAEFGLMAVYLFVIYAISRPFGAAAQAGFGIGLRIVQAGFMPVVALGFSVAPVAGQNFGARLPDRVKKTYVTAVSMAAGIMAVWAVACHFGAAPMVHIFSGDPQVVAVGEEYLRIIAWTFVGSGLVFVSSSMFQALGNTLPPLAASFGRLLLTAIPAVLLARMPGFELRWIWYLSAWTIVFQVITVLLLLQREFRLRLAPAAMFETGFRDCSYRLIHFSIGTRATSFSNDVERQVVERLEPDARLPHVELLAASLELGPEPLLRLLVAVDSHQIDSHVVLLRRQRDIAERMSVVGVWESRQRHAVHQHARAHGFLDSPAGRLSRITFRTLLDRRLPLERERVEIVLRRLRCARHEVPSRARC